MGHSHDLQSASCLAFAGPDPGALIAVLTLAVGIGATTTLFSALQALLLAAVAVVLAAIIACWLPARRAAKLDPLEALRPD